MYQGIRKTYLFLLSAMLFLFVVGISNAQLVTFSVGSRTYNSADQTYSVEILANVAAGQTWTVTAFSLEVAGDPSAMDLTGISDGDVLIDCFTTASSSWKNFASAVYPSFSIGVANVSIPKTGQFSVGKVKFHVIDGQQNALDNITFYYDDFELLTGGVMAENNAVALNFNCSGNDCFSVQNPAACTISLNGACATCTPPANPVCAPPVVNGNNVNLAWTNAGTPTGYYVEYSTDNNWPAVATDVTTLSTAFTNLPNGTYHWRVQAHNAATCVSGWVTGTDFSINYSAPCTTPDAITQAVAVATQTGATFTWVSNAQHYVVSYASNANFTGETIITPNPTTATAAVSGLTPNSTYWWRVKGVNVSGSNTCETGYVSGTFTTLCNTPDAPVGMASAGITSDAATLTWTSVAGMEYQVRLASGNPIPGQGVVTASPYVLSNLYSGTTYYWQVRGIASNGCTSDWSALQQFTTVAVPPTLSTPANNAACVDPAINFMWQNLTSATQYQIQVFVSGQTTPVVDQTTTAPIYNTVLLPNTTYVWAVRANVNGTWTAYSANSTFSTTIPAPALNLPANNATKVAYLPTLTWGAITGATGYHLVVADNANFTAPVVDANVTGASYTFTNALANFTTYYWKVAATNATCASGFSAVSNFKTQLTLTAPVLTAPANNATGVALAATMDWNDVTNATGYVIEIANNIAFVGSETHNVSLSQYAEVMTLYKTDVYWRVKAVNTAEAVESPVSGTFKYTTLNVPAPVLVSPAPDAMINIATAPVFSWNAVPNATSYTLTVTALDGDMIDYPGITGTSYTVTGLNWNADYAWFVTAYQGANFTPSEVRSFATTAIPVPVLTAFTRHFDITEAIDFQWSTVPVATSYDLQLANNANFTGATVYSLISGNHLNHAALTAGSYYWRVRTVIGTQNGAWSTPETVVSELRTPLTVTFSNTAQTICSGYALLSAPIIANASPGSIFTYSWSPAANVNNPSAPQPYAINIPVGTTMTFTLTVSEEGTTRTATAQQSVTITGQPEVVVPSVFRTSLAERNINLNAQVTSPTAAAAANYRFTWTDRNNMLIGETVGLATLMYTASNVTGLYRTQVIAHVGNCESVAKNMYVFITLRRDSDEEFTAGQNGGVMYAYNANNGNDLKVQAYFNGEGNNEITIVNLLGQEVAHYNSYGDAIDESFDISSLTAGVYFVVAKNANDFMTQKIIKN